MVKGSSTSSRERESALNDLSLSFGCFPLFSRKRNNEERRYLQCSTNSIGSETIWKKEEEKKSLFYPGTDRCRDSEWVGTKPRVQTERGKSKKKMNNKIEWNSFSADRRAREVPMDVRCLVDTAVDFGWWSSWPVLLPIQLSSRLPMLFVYFVVFFSVSLSCFLSRDLVRTRVGKHWCPSIYEAASGNGPKRPGRKNGG